MPIQLKIADKSGGDSSQRPSLSCIRSDPHDFNPHRHCPPATRANNDRISPTRRGESESMGSGWYVVGSALESLSSDPRMLTVIRLMI